VARAHQAPGHRRGAGGAPAEGHTQKNPRGTPGTFSVTAWVNEQLHAGGAVLTDRVQRQIDAIVRRTKPLSRAYELLVGVLFGQPLGAAAVMREMEVDRRTINTEVH